MNIRALSLTFLFFAPFSLASEQGEVKPVDQDIFKNLLKSDTGQKIYSACQSKESAKDFHECLTGQWNALATNSPDEAKKLAQELGTVEVTYDEKGNQVRKPTGAKINNLNVNTLSETFTDNVDPATLALRKYLREQLSNALYGDLPEDKITKKKLVDHNAFYTLFESQVGQNIIVAVSDYCMNSNMHLYGNTEINPSAQNSAAPTTSKKGNVFFALELERVRNREINLNAIKNDFGNTGNREKRKDAFNRCISSISSICHDGVNFTKEPPQFTREQDEHKQDAQNYACLVTDYLVQARQSLLKVSKIKEQIRKNSEESGQAVSFEELSQNKFYSDGQSKGEKSIRQLAIQTSTDIKNAGIKEAAESAGEKLKECKNGDDAACKGFVSDDLEAQKELLANEFLKAKAQQARLAQSLEEDPDNAIKYLKEEGYSEEEASNIVETLKSDSDTTSDAITKINERYQKQKDAVISSLANKIYNKSVAEGSSLGAKAEDIKTQLNKKADTLINVMHFANLASTYLTISVKKDNGEDGPSSINTVAAFSELSGESMASDSKRSPSNQDESSLYADNEGLLDQNLEALEELKGESNTEDKGTGASFGVDQINSILPYADKNNSN